MLDIGWSEMLVIAVVVIVIVGPKELPGMLRAFGRTTSKLRVMANDFRKQFDEALKEAELDDLKKVADDVRALNPTNEIKKALSPMEKAAQDVRAGLDSAFKPAATPQPDPAVASLTATPVPAEPLKTGAAAMPAAAARATPTDNETAAPAPKPAAKKPAATNAPTATKPTVAKAVAGAKSAAKPKAAAASAAKPRAASAATNTPKPKAPSKPRATKTKAGGDAA